MRFDFINIDNYDYTHKHCYHQEYIRNKNGRTIGEFFFIVEAFDAVKDTVYLISDFRYWDDSSKNKEYYTKMEGINHGTFAYDTGCEKDEEPVFNWFLDCHKAYYTGVEPDVEQIEVDEYKTVSTYNRIITQFREFSMITPRYPISQEQVLQMNSEIWGVINKYLGDKFKEYNLE